MNIGVGFFHYGLVIFILSIIVGLILSFALKNYVYKHIKAINDKRLKSGIRDSITSNTRLSFMARIVKIIINIIIVLSILTQISMFSEIGKIALGASSVLALVVGLAAQESASTLIGGFMLTFYKPFIIGDIIYLPDNDLSGRVVQVGLRHTTIQTINNTKIIVPNNLMNSAIIENREEDGKYYNLLIYPIAYNADVEKAIELLTNIAKKHPLAMDESLEVVVDSFGESAINLKLLVYTKDVPDGQRLKYDINKQILKEFTENNIEIPFNTHTVYLRK